LRVVHKLPSRAERLRAKGFLNARQIAQLIDSKPSLVDYWRQQGLLKGIRLNDRNEYLYENPDADVLQQIKRRTRLKLTNHLS
jgi:DNA-binding transcriptional MerR regulator